MAKTLLKRRAREPDITRDKLLKAAFEEIYRRGFQAASLDTILAKAGVSKGALYHHFPDKASLGYAVVDEVVKGLLLERWGVLEPPTGDPVTALQRIREVPGVLRTQTQVVLSTLFERPVADGNRPSN